MIKIVLLTILAEPAKLKLMVRDLEAGSFRYSLIKLIVHRLVQVKDPPALIASKVVVILLSAFVSTYGATQI